MNLFPHLLVYIIYQRNGNLVHCKINHDAGCAGLNPRAHSQNPPEGLSTSARLPRFIGEGLASGERGDIRTNFTEH